MTRALRISLIPFAISAALLISACGDSSDSESGSTETPATTAPQTTQPAESTTATPADDDAPATDDGREQASQAAVAFVENETGTDARTTGIYAEDDGGARWEVEVTTADNQEYDVLVDASGEVIRSIPMGSS
jgi:hypothetical protein